MDPIWNIMPNRDIIATQPVDLEYPLFTLRLDGEDRDTEVTGPISTGLSFAKVRRAIEAGPMIGMRLEERYGVDWIAGRSWTVTGCPSPLWRRTRRYTPVMISGLAVGKSA
jgi:hypothetical protein